MFTRGFWPLRPVQGKASTVNHSLFLAVSFHCGFQSLLTSLQGTHHLFFPPLWDGPKGVCSRQGEEKPFKGHIK